MKKQCPFCGDDFPRLPKHLPTCPTAPRPGMDSADPEPDPDAQIETVLVMPGGTTKLHIPNDARPLCGTDGSFREKQTSVFPPVHRDWCRVCLRVWQDDRSE